MTCSRHTRDIVAFKGDSPNEATDPLEYLVCPSLPRYPILIEARTCRVAQFQSGLVISTTLKRSRRPQMDLRNQDRHSIDRSTKEDEARHSIARSAGQKLADLVSLP